MTDHQLDPEPLQLLTVGGLPTAISQPWRAPRQLDAIDITGPSGSTALVMVCPTTTVDRSFVVTRTTNGAQNTYDAGNRRIRIPASWRVIVQWSAPGSATALLYATEIDNDE